METKVIKDIQDLTYLRWSHVRSSNCMAGNFLKSESTINNKKQYYKLSNFDSINGVIGHESVNEIIVDRLLTILGVEHIHYQLINAKIEIDGREYNTYLCVSEDFKEPGESKIALDDYYRVNSLKGESHYDFCVRLGFKKYIDQMIAVDYLILNRDRHGANIEVLRNARAKSLRIAPLFDHGLSLLYSCYNDEDINKFDVLKDKKCQNFIGGNSCYDNLNLINNKYVFNNKLNDNDKDFIFKDLDGILSNNLINKIWELIIKRYMKYEKLCNL